MSHMHKAGQKVEGMRHDGRQIDEMSAPTLSRKLAKFAEELAVFKIDLSFLMNIPL